MNRILETPKHYRGLSGVDALYQLWDTVMGDMTNENDNIEGLVAYKAYSSRYRLYHINRHFQTTLGAITQQHWMKI